MFRALGTFGLGILFVMISPTLRQSLLADTDALQQSIEHNSPWSYAALGVCGLALLMFFLHRAKQPRS